MRLPPATIAALVLSVCGLAAAHPAAGGTAGADCAAPANAVKRLICADPHLSDLNHRTKTAYHQALARPGADRAALLSARKDWKAARDGCAYNNDVHSCVQAAYQRAGFGQLTAQFYNQLAPPSAVLNWKGDHQVLNLRRSGYLGSEQAAHRGEVKLDFNGATFICRPE
ncbi:lysozyme inhibitor LprI family protein [Mycobacterium helveticum]|uniref:DUF1311 domain-containing protein n=1 Tax=Mycobacterium helveticum TaxID=2592811 RepID=A0A557XW13_9MYCO|nr:hypothetical protein [Mycobacterium helveticum]TVS86247.1 hypothetical protein FPZ46_12150 [Mycobacterium helveticum]TVS90233.1 hypothetical protein FPZ47_10205 [Mycobacterium helveticum]